MMLYLKEVVFQFILQFKKYISNMHVSILNKTIVYRQYIFRIIFVTSSAALSCLPTSYRIAGERRYRTRTVRALHRGRAGTVQVLCRACTGPVQFLCKTVGHIGPTRPLSVKAVSVLIVNIWKWHTHLSTTFLSSPLLLLLPITVLHNHIENPKKLTSKQCHHDQKVELQQIFWV